MKISKALTQGESDDELKMSCSFEYFPPKTLQGMDNLYNRMERMAEWGLPEFVDITWGAGGRTAESTCEMVENAQKYIGLNTCMHLTCTDMTETQIFDILDKALSSGCRNILALRGDKPIENKSWEQTNGGFKYAKDLVLAIRNRYGNQFCIGVAGYPEGYDSSENLEESIDFLKEKCDAGADFIITQMFYDVDLFLSWINKCRDKGINLPIFPGIMPIYNYEAFIRRAKWSGCKIPQKFILQLEPVRFDDEEVRKIGSELMINLCSKLVTEGFRHLHFYTMNLETPVKLILNGLKEKGFLSRHMDLPWRKGYLQSRKEENVRPIFWKNRTRSYMSRTQNWDEFPNGRWGNTASPAFVDVSLYGVYLKISKEKAKLLWGEPHSLLDILSLFIRYIENKLEALPWSDTPIDPEASYIRSDLVNISKLRILVVNSQPAVNGVPSDHPHFGWGPKGGIIYQKAYLEMFIHPVMIPKLIANTKRDSNFSYYIVNSRGDLRSNAGTRGPNALTWGVFKGKDIVQPTIIDLISFLAWKEEAFKLGNDWASIYPKNSISNELISSIMANWFLCVIVHNDYQKEKAIFDIFHGFDQFKDEIH